MAKKHSDFPSFQLNFFQLHVSTAWKLNGQKWFENCSIELIPMKIGISLLELITKSRVTLRI